MGTIKVHEFISLDGVIDAPTWTFDYGFDPAMGQDIGNLMSSCEAILLRADGRRPVSQAVTSETVRAAGRATVEPAGVPPGIGRRDS